MVAKNRAKVDDRCDRCVVTTVLMHLSTIAFECGNACVCNIRVFGEKCTWGELLGAWRDKAVIMRKEPTTVGLEGVWSARVVTVLKTVERWKIMHPAIFEGDPVGHAAVFTVFDGRL